MFSGDKDSEKQVNYKEKYFFLLFPRCILSSTIVRFTKFFNPSQGNWRKNTVSPKSFFRKRHFPDFVDTFPEKVVFFLKRLTTIRSGACKVTIFFADNKRMQFFLTLTT